MKLMTLAAIAALTTTPLLAESHAGSGDAAAGEREFRTCAACHSIVSPDGEMLAGRGAKTGPNLYGVIGRLAGSVEDFRYGTGMPAAGEAGLVWDVDNIVEYIADPQGYIREFTGDNSLRVTMAKQRVRKPEDLAAFLASHSPVMEEAATEEAVSN